MSEEIPQPTESKGKPPFPDPIQSVLDGLKTLKFGTIQLTVHEGKLVQIDITERKRFSN